MFKKSLLAAALALAAAGAQASVVVTIDYDGAGADAAIKTSSLDWSPDSALITPVTPGDSVNSPYVGQLLQTYVQGTLGSVRNNLGKTVTSPGLNNTYEWTFVGAFREQVSAISIDPTDPLNGPASLSLQSVTGGTNYFEVWVSAVDSNTLAGTGYNNGIKILSGTIDPYNSSTGAGDTKFTSDPKSNVVPLDQANGNNDYPTLYTTTGSGSGDVNLTIGYIDTNYFTGVSVGDAMTIFLQTNLGLPFGQVDPSRLVAGQLAADSSVIGTINGLNGNSLLLQSDAASNFDLKRIPEPTSVALASLGLLGLGLRRRSAK